MRKHCLNYVPSRRFYITVMASLHCALEQDILILTCLVLVQPRKICPDITEIFVDWGVKNQIRKKNYAQKFGLSINGIRQIKQMSMRPNKK